MSKSRQPRGPLGGTKLEIVKLGYQSSRPWIVVFGRQPEPVRKYEQVLAVREDLLSWPGEVLLPYLERIMSDTSRAGYEWKGQILKKAQGWTAGAESGVVRRKAIATVRRRQMSTELTPEQAAYAEFRPAPNPLGGELGPEGKCCRNCGRGRAEEARFYKAKKAKDGLQTYCVDCMWWKTHESYLLRHGK